MLVELRDPSVNVLFKTEFLTLINSLLVVIPSRSDLKLLVGTIIFILNYFLSFINPLAELWKHGLTYDFLTEIELYFPLPALVEQIEYYLDEAELFDGYVPPAHVVAEKIEVRCDFMTHVFKFLDR